MKISKSKSFSLFALFLSLIITVSIFTLPNVIAHSPAQEISTYTRVAVAPNPVGLEQPVTIVFWNTFPFPGWTRSDQGWTFYVNITGPNNVTSSLGRFVSDSTGRATTTFLPNAVGNWTVTVTFPQTVYTWNENAAQRVYTNDIFLASFGTATFAVQATPIPSALPSDFTSSGGWFHVTSNWLGIDSPQGTSFDNYVKQNITGSSTAHVMWTKPIEPGGVVGGTDVGVPGDTYYTGISYAMRFTSTYIMNGKLYYREPLGETSAVGGYIIVDLRNGNEITRTSVTSSPGFGYSCNGIDVFITSSGTTWTLLNPATLTAFSPALSVTGVPTGTSRMGPSGEILRIMLTTSGGNLVLRQWNSSKVIVSGMSGAVAGGGVDKYDFYDVPTTYNGTNFTIPSNQRTIIGAFPNDVLLTSDFAAGTGTGDYTFWAISLKPENRGAITWNQTYSRELNGTQQGIGPVDPIGKVITVGYGETMQYVGYNYETGEKWGPTPSLPPYDYYSFFSGGAQYSTTVTGLAVNGRLINCGYSGLVTCYNMTDGKILWTYGNGGPGNSTYVGFQSPWGYEPLQPFGIADGKYYTATMEHSPNTPLYKLGQVRCIDVMTGKEVWTLSGYVAQRLATGGMLFANGFTVYLNSYDGQIYATAKGPSVTSVSTTSTVAQGSKILIKGTILDGAAGTNQSEQSARFPNGVACVSDDNMTQWMEYVYMNRPRPSNITGVDVELSAFGPDGAVIEIGNVTSDDTGFFNALWTPPTVGTYTVVAKFAGSGGYYPSSAQTAFAVESVPVPTATPSATPEPFTDTYILGSTATIIAAIIILGAFTLLLLRKFKGEPTQ